MIKIDNTEVFGIEHAIKSMRNPYESYAKADSENNAIGEKDMKLCRTLIHGGTEHRKFLRMIHVQAEVKAPLYWWKEFDTYKVGTVANSSSTMHLIHKRDLTLDDFSYEHLYECNKTVLQHYIEQINKARQTYAVNKNKSYWWQIIQLLPSSFNQLRTIDLNYEVLLSIYKQRKSHKLDEWREFCKWIESLPHMNEFLIASQKEN